MSPALCGGQPGAPFKAEHSAVGYSQYLTRYEQKEASLIQAKSNTDL